MPQPLAHELATIVEHFVEAKAVFDTRVLKMVTSYCVTQFFSLGLSLFKMSSEGARVVVELTCQRRSAFPLRLATLAARPPTLVLSAQEDTPASFRLKGWRTSAPSQPQYCRLRSRTAYRGTLSSQRTRRRICPSTDVRHVTQARGQLCCFRDTDTWALGSHADESGIATKSFGTAVPVKLASISFSDYDRCVP